MAWDIAKTKGKEKGREKLRTDISPRARLHNLPMSAPADDDGVDAEMGRDLVACSKVLAYA